MEYREIDRKELKRQARERIACADPKFWLVSLTYLALTTGVSWCVSLLLLPASEASSVPFLDVGMFFQLLLILYGTVVQFGMCLWALWTYRKMNPGLGSLTQGFSVAGRVILMQLGIWLRLLGWYLLVFMVLGTPAMFIMVTGSPFQGLLGLLVFAAVLMAVLIIISLRYSLAPYLLADRPDDGASAPLYRSVQLMRGWKWEIFKLELSFVIWDIINFLLSTFVTAVFLFRAGLLLPEETTLEWFMACSELVNSVPVAILSTLVTVPLSLWLIPYRATARAGFYNARLAIAREQYQRTEMPPL